MTCLRTTDLTILFFAYFLIKIVHVQEYDSLGLIENKKERGIRLTGYVFETFEKMNVLHCVKECMIRPRCVSINVQNLGYKCELNYRTKETAPTESNVDWLYSDIDSWDKSIVKSCKNNNCTSESKCIVLVTGNFTCAVVECGDPPTVDNAVVVSANRSVTGVTQYSCNAGYGTRGGTNITCKPDGQWTSLNLTCYQCTDPPTVPHAATLVADKSIGGVTSYECDMNYVANGTTSVTCGSEGEWTSVSFCCYYNSCPSCSYDRVDNLGICVKRHLTKMRWADAKAVCQAEGTVLYISNTLDKSTYLNTLISGQHVWIGARRTNGQIQWEDGNLVIGHTMWKAREPDNNEVDEDCIVRESDNYWYDRTCNKTYVFACASV